MWRRIAVIWLLVLVSAITYGQGETSNWYFGHNAGIRFNNDGSVTPLDDGRIRTFEGCATISDPFGELLFYTDGITVYDRTHRIMLGGRALYGDSSSTQSAIIVPDPGNPDRYYIFTVDTKIFENDPDFGLNYSIVDMTGNNGDGEVVSKNINLLADCSEKITAVLKDCSDQSFWVLTLASISGASGLMDTFHAFEVNTTGVVVNSVRSTIPDLEVQDPRGYLKLSPDGTKVVSANATSGLYLYDFDASTGIVSNQQPIQISGVNNVAYGVEFSPNGELLYIHASNDQQGPTGHSSSLYQYDLLAPDISASEILLDKRNTYRAALQLAANGKIYRTVAENYAVGTPILGAINNPNERGVAADYLHRAVDLGSRNATQGLPPFVQSFFNKTAIIQNPDGSTSNSLELCEGDSFTLQTESLAGATYDWEKDGQPLSAAANSFQLSNAGIADAGRYTVTITTTDPTECPIVGEAFIRVNPVPEAPELTLTQCDIDPAASNDGFHVFDLEQSIVDPALEYSFYETVADRDMDHPILNPDQYTNTTAFNQLLYYQVTNEFGCLAFGELRLEVQSNPFTTDNEYTLYSCDLNAEDTSLTGSFDLRSFALTQYPGIEVSFYGSLENTSTQTNPLADTIESEPEIIYARLEGDNGCLGVDRLDLDVLPVPQFEFDEEFLLCTDNPPLNIKGPAGFDYYRWERINGSEIISDQASVEITEVGNYRLTAGYYYEFPDLIIDCDHSVEFEVLPSNMAVIQEVKIDDFSDFNQVEVLVSGDGIYEYSLDGTSYQDSNYFGDVLAGFYTLYVRDLNGCGISEEDISVLGYPKFFTPNGDGINDLWKITGTSEQFQSDAFITIYDRYGKLLAQISPLEEGWNGMLQSNPLPASDYWFRVELSDGREITGHFALKR